VGRERLLRGARVPKKEADRGRRPKRPGAQWMLQPQERHNHLNLLAL